jgi:predicted dithiol-disulfide oxidoreductase (DUF899 family)
MHRTVTREQWNAERQQLLAEEKEFTRRRDALGEKRRALPWVKIDKRYEFDSPQGRVTLAALFRGKSQLFVQHVMQSPGQPLQCVGCALGVDLRTRMGWRIPFYSSFGSDFNYDFGVSFRPEEVAAGRALYNYRHISPGMEDLPGYSTFYKDEAGDIFHTYSVFERGGEDFMAIYRVLEVMPKGRNEDPDKGMTGWARPHNMYGKGGEVALNGRYTPPASCCM